jgi:hypothetical protein
MSRARSSALALAAAVAVTGLGAATASAAQPRVAPVPATKTSLLVKYRYILGEASTEITRLSILATPGTKVRVTEKRHTKLLLTWSYTADSRVTSLKGLKGTALKPGTAIRIRAGVLTKRLTIRAGRAPAVR